MWEKHRAAWASLFVLGALGVSGGCSSGDSSEGESEAPAGTVRSALESLQAAFPAARIESAGTAISRLYGAELAQGATHAEAAERFRVAQARALGLEARELTPQTLQNGTAVAAATPTPLGLMWDAKTGAYKFWLYRYGQSRDGLPVHGATLLALVKNGGHHPVVWAASSLRAIGAFAPAVSAQAPVVDRDKALRAIRGTADFTGNLLGAPTSVVSTSQPSLVVFAGTEKANASPRVASEFVIETSGPAGKWRVVADARTGDVLDTESLIHFADVTGTVSGVVTEGLKSMDCGPASPTSLKFAEVTGPSGSVFTNENGAFTLPNPGTSAINVTSPVGGQFFDVTSVTGAPNDTLTQSVVPPGPVSFLHNSANTSQLVTGQANTYRHSSDIREFLLSYVPNYPTIANQTNFAVYVNRTDVYCPGNAWYDSSIPSINFCVSSATHGNTAFASVTHHEYGHHIVQAGGSGQGPYGEGMSDVVALLYAKDPGLGYGFYLNQCSTPLRSADNTCQYSPTSCSTCGSASHSCGNLISGSIWSVRKELIESEPENHDAILSALVLNSIPMHIGTTIGPQIPIDLITLDDDDGILGNGSPHYAEICAGFGAHGIPCPPLLTGLGVGPTTGLSAEGPLGGPFTPGSLSYTVTNIGTTGSLSYQVTPAAPTPWLSISNATGSLGAGQQTQVVVSIDQDAAAALPNGGYSTLLQFTNLSDGAGNTTRPATLEVGVPSPIFTETFEGGLGQFALDPSASSRWHVTSSCASAQPGHSLPSSLYFGIDSSCTFDAGAVSTGTVTSNPIMIEDTSVVRLRFNYFLTTENNANYDWANVQVSVNDAPFTVVASNHQGGVPLSDGSGSWQQLSVDLSSLVSSLPTASVRLRFGFDTRDGAANAYPGFLVDDVQVLAFTGSCNDDEECNDGAYCNGVEVCTDGACTAGTPVACDDGVACTEDSCNEETDSCTATPQSSACSDGQACNGAEICDVVAGCQPGEPLDCDDASVCTTDACDQVLGCVHTPIGCSDGNSCTVDACDPVTGCENPPLSCDDSDACTVDACSTDVGCVNTSINCDDNDACTVDACDPATGCATTPLSCDDGNVCTNDSCNSATGCQYTNNTNSCDDDGDPCTTDVCNSGVCTHEDNGTCSNTGPFIENGGQVVIEAEHFTGRVARANHTWDVTNNGAASGGQDMTANPNNNTNINTGYTTGSPQLDFAVNFTTTGTYHVWVRGMGATQDDDSLHAGLDGAGPSTADRITGFTNVISWRKSTADGPVATINVTSPGVHTLNVWMREDGFRFDKILLTTNAGFTPAGAGPAESPRQPGGASPCASFCQNPTTFAGGHFQSGNIGTTARCYETTGNINGGNCGNFVNPRTLFVNGTQMTCNYQNWPSIPARVNGGYCVYTTAGNHPWAYFTTW